ncbi:hypothetical protein GCM10010873_06120 [Cypionkella aquatica]|uniref:Uncharacterized protein n=1 Tax=Cypionkella aquatica TaxID=1756042 RepID=A0AA37WZG1_9RHOB|nr:hypothetical protein [Cypionkella aquatica]GLS85639.1 hypothetical protein GCM10010873_06120 [Cypionkella aquatica]
MADPNLVDFYSNVARFEKKRAKGYGFDAAGTLGRSYFNPPARKRRSYLMPLLMVLCAGFGLKGMIYQSVGPKSYDQRVQALQVGEGFDRLGGWLMQADPVTVFVAGKITEGLASIK